MPDWVFGAIVIWHFCLILALLGYLLLARGSADKLVAFDGLSSAFVSVFVVLGIHREESFFLDVAVVVAMIGFVQTVATARLLEQREDIR